MTGTLYSMASAILRIEKECHPSVTTISQAVSRMLARTSSFCLSLRSLMLIVPSCVTFCNSVRQNYALFLFHQIFLEKGRIGDNSIPALLLHSACRWNSVT